MAFARHFRSVCNTGEDIRLFDTGVLFEELLDRPAAGQEIKHQRYPDTMPTDAGLSEADVRIYRYSGEEFLFACPLVHRRTSISARQIHSSGPAKGTCRRVRATVRSNSAGRSVRPSARSNSVSRARIQSMSRWSQVSRMPSMSATSRDVPDRWSYASPDIARLSAIHLFRTASSSASSTPDHPISRADAINPARRCSLVSIEVARCPSMSRRRTMDQRRMYPAAACGEIGRRFASMAHDCTVHRTRWCDPRTTSAIARTTWLGTIGKSARDKRLGRSSHTGLRNRPGKIPRVDHRAFCPSKASLRLSRLPLP